MIFMVDDCTKWYFLLADKRHHYSVNTRNTNQLASHVVDELHRQLI